MFHYGAFIFHVEHLRYRGAENIGIEQSHLVSFPRQSNGEVGADGAFAHASLTGSDGDDVFDSRKQFRLDGSGSLFRLHRDVAFDVDIRIGIGKNSLLSHLHDRFDERVVRFFGDEGEAHFHAIDADVVGHHACRHDILSRSGVTHIFQCINN